MSKSNLDQTWKLTLTTKIKRSFPRFTLLSTLVLVSVLLRRNFRRTLRELSPTTSAPIEINELGKGRGQNVGSAIFLVAVNFSKNFTE